MAKPNDLETDQNMEKANMLFLQYRGKVTDDYVRALRHLKTTCAQPYFKHTQLCGVNPSFDSVVKILQSTCKSIPYLETLEALCQRELNPQINTKDEFRKRELTIKL